MIWELDDSALSLLFEIIVPLESWNFTFYAIGFLVFYSGAAHVLSNHIFYIDKLTLQSFDNYTSQLKHNSEKRINFHLFRLILDVLRLSILTIIMESPNDEA